MDIKSIGNKITVLIKKYRYAAIVLLVGVVLMTIPEVRKNDKTVSPVTVKPQSEPTMEERLSSILSGIDGAGEVSVMLTEAAGEEIFYQTNDNISNGENASGKDHNTVIVTDSNRNQNGLIRQINPPVYLGAIIACQGADNPTVQLAIVDAVSKITGLGANQISVLKMK